MKRTKMLCAITSVLMAVLPVAMSVSVPIGALDTLTTSSQNKIDSVLREKMAEASENEKIPVAIWYSDVDQDNIDKLTAQKVGFTRDDVAVAYEMPSTGLLASLEKEEEGAADEMQAYLKRTESLRKLERERTDEYIMTRREFSRSKYNEKSAKLIKDVDIKSEDISFQSQYAPMILAELTKEQILQYKENPTITEIYYDDSAEAMVVDDGTEEEPDIFIGNNMEILKSVIGLDKVEEQIFSKMENRPTINIGVTERYGKIQSHSELSSEKVIPVGNTTVYTESSHMTKVVRTINSSVHGVAKNCIVYTANQECANVEALLDEEYDISLINSSGSFINNNGNVYYSSMAMWYDHLVAYHGVTVVAAACNQPLEYGRIYAPALAYNVIGVGTYLLGNNFDVFTSELADDTMSYRSGYINTTETNICAEKPDVVMPGQETSYATPILTASIALMLELKPSLAMYPQAIKAIVLASCHRKVLPSADGETTETIDEGITDRQGAGAPNIWAMASIVCQGTYGVGRISSAGTQGIRRFMLPTGSSSDSPSKLNVSITWLRENVILNGISHNNEIYATSGDDINMNLYVYRNGVQVGKSEIGEGERKKSSTEMAYIELDSSNWDYEIQIRKSEPYEQVVRYGYAYSTDKAYIEPVTDEGIYYIRNYLTDKYLTLDTATDETTMQYFASTSTGRQPQMWVLKGTQGDYEILPAYGSVGEKLNFGAQVGTNPYYKAVLGTSDLNLSLTSWENDTTLEPDAYVLTSTSGGSNNILSYTSSTGIFVRSTTAPIVNMYRMWVLEDINYRKGDANTDGELDIKDVTAIQKYIGELEAFNNIQWYLADYNCDGTVSVLDVTAIQKHIAALRMIE